MHKPAVFALIVLWAASLPGYAADDVTTATEALKAGRTAEAIRILTAIVRRNPSDASAWKVLGRAAIAARQPEKAVEAFSSACSLNSKEPDACYYLGRTLHALGRYEEARRPLDEALAVVPDQARARTHRAIALNFVGLVQPDKAETHFLASIQFFSGDAAEEDPRVDYGAFLVRQGRAEESLPMLEKSVKARPDSSRARAELGRALLDAGNPDAAARSLERAVALDPSAWAARLLLGRAYRQLGRFEESERELTLGRKGWASQNNPSRDPNP